MKTEQEQDVETIPKVEEPESDISGQKMKAEPEQVEPESVFEEDRTNQCQICLKIFNDEIHCRIHIELVHLKMKKVACEKCPEMFQTKRTLRTHILKFHGDTKVLKDYHQCEHCKKHFGTNYSLRKHVQMKHVNSRPFQCELCDKNYNLQYMLKDHIEAAHQNIRRYVCRICNAKFTSQTGLNYHTQGVHSTERKFLCELCPKTFLTKVDCNGHRKTHNQPEMCNICGGMFKSLKGHMRERHGKSKKVSFQCPACDKVLKSKKGLDYHLDNSHSAAQSKAPLPGINQSDIKPELDDKNLEIQATNSGAPLDSDIQNSASEKLEEVKEAFIFALQAESLLENNDVNCESVDAIIN